MFNSFEFILFEIETDFFYSTVKNKLISLILTIENLISKTPKFRSSSSPANN